MSENETQKQPDQNVVGSSTSHNAPRSARRRLLKSTVAIPVIMTLHSGAALARSSNLSGAAPAFDDAAGDENDVFCALHKGQPDGEAYDFGDSPSYTRIPRQEDGGINRTEDEIMQACEGQEGILISSHAFNSIGGRTGWEEI